MIIDCLNNFPIPCKTQILLNTVPQDHPVVLDCSSCPHIVLYTQSHPFQGETYDVKLYVLWIKSTWLLKISSEMVIVTN